MNSKSNLLASTFFCGWILMGLIVGGVAFASPSPTPALRPAYDYPPLEKHMNKTYDARGYLGYTVVVAMEQPVPGTRTVIDENFDSGHSFLRIAKHGKNAWTSYVGFRAAEIDDNGNISGAMHWQDDALHRWHVAKAFEIQEKDALSLLEFTKLWTKGKNYNLTANNCATFTIDALASIHIDQSRTGISPHKWQIPADIFDSFIYQYTFLKDIKDFSGYSPADAAEDMKQTPGCIFP